MFDIRYFHRWQGLKTVLDHMSLDYDAIIDPTMRPRAILHLVRALQRFGQAQFRFFYEGFGGEYDDPAYTRVYPKLVPSDEYPPEHVVATVLAQIAEDVILIQRAAEQRQGAFARVLAKADALAATALWPQGMPRYGVVPPNTKGDAFTKNNFQVRTIVTYFGKAVDVRILPYAQVALIGIPYSALSDQSSFLAIPHEVGHFRYWYSYPAPDRRYLNLRERFYSYDAASTALPWSQEIFADVYSVLIGGPLAAIAAQGWAVEHSALGFMDMTSHDEHLFPAIRPLTHIKALLEFPESLLDDTALRARKEMAYQLFARWKNVMRARNVLSESGEIANRDARGLVSQDVGLQAAYPVDQLIQKAVRALTAAYTDLGTRQRNWGWSDPARFRWDAVADLDHVEVVDGLLNALTRGASMIDDTRLENLFPYAPSRDEIPQLWKGWALNAKKYLTNARSDMVIPSGTFADDMNPMQEPPHLDKWVRVFGGGGWTTEGPCVAPPH